MAIIKTRWATPLPKKEEVVKMPVPKKKKSVEPKVEERPAAPVVDDPTAEEFIATLPKKKREVKKANIEE